MLMIYLQMLETEEDRTKFELIYQYYKGLLHEEAYKIVRNEHDADDAMHEAFLAIIENFTKISNICSLKTRAYFVVIVRRKAIDILRERSKIAEFGESWYRAESSESMDEIDSVIEELPDHYKELLILRFAIGLTTVEIAKLQGKPLTAVRKMLTRARSKLRELCEERGIKL